MKIFDAEPGIPYNKETHDNIVKMMAQAYAIAEKAKLENVDKSWEFRALVRIARIEFINARYNRDHKTDEPELPQITDNRKKYEYYLGGAALYGDKTYEEALPSIESSLKYTLEMRAKTISDMGTWSKTNVFFYDRSKAFLAPVATPESLDEKVAALLAE